MSILLSLFSGLGALFLVNTFFVFWQNYYDEIPLLIKLSVGVCVLFSSAYLNYLRFRLKRNIRTEISLMLLLVLISSLFFIILWDSRGSSTDFHEVTKSNMRLSNSPAPVDSIIFDDKFTISKELKISLMQEANRYKKFESTISVYLVSNLYVSGEKLDGYTYGNNITYIDVNYGEHDPITIFHHEVFHVLEKNVLDITYIYEEWRELNQNIFKYCIDEKTSVDGFPSYYFSMYDGFTNNYSLMSPSEDMACLYSEILISSHKNILFRLSNNDAILRKKIDYLNDIISKYIIFDLNKVMSGRVPLQNSKSDGFNENRPSDKSKSRKMTE
jgi:hypothetical protein